MGHASGRRRAGRRGPGRDTVRLGEIAERLGVTTRVVRAWRWRGELPSPRRRVGRRPEWSWPEVQAWARYSGRT